MENAPVIPNLRRSSLLISGDRACNVLDLTLSIIGSSLANASLPSCLILADTPSEGTDLDARLNGWISNYFAAKQGGDAQASHKRKTIAYRYNAMVERPITLAHIIRDSTHITSPCWVLRDDSSQSQSGMIATWHEFANAIIEEVAATCVHVVKAKDAMYQLPVDPKSYTAWWECRDYFPASHSQRINSAVLLTDHSTGKQTVWRSRSMAGGPEIYFPALDEVVEFGPPKPDDLHA